MAGEGLLDAQGFFWVPSLAGPTSIAARQAGVGTAWLFPFVDGTPPIGWHDALCYLSFPMLLLVFQVGLLNQHHQTRWGRPTVVRLFSACCRHCCCACYCPPAIATAIPCQGR